MSTVPFAPATAEVVAGWLYAKTGNTRNAVRPVDAVHIPCVDEEEWLTARAAGVGASEAGIIAGLSSFMSPYALWHQKANGWRLPRTEAQRWGHLVEDPIADLFAEDHPELLVVKPLGHPYSLWRHPLFAWMRCTPDRLAVTEDGLVLPVELKSDEGGKGWGPPGSDEVPLHHRVQVMWQEAIFGAPAGWVVRKRASGKGRVVGYRVEYDEAALDGWRRSAADFLASLAMGEAPEPDGSKSTTAALQDLNPAVDEGTTVRVDPRLAWRWQLARAAKRHAVEVEARLSNQLRAAMGRAEYGEPGDGRPFVRRSVGKRAGYEVAPGAVDRLLEVFGGQHDEAGAVPAQDGPEPGAEGVQPAGDEGLGRGAPVPGGQNPGATAATAEERSADRAGTAGEVDGRGGEGEGGPGEGGTDCEPGATDHDPSGEGGRRVELCGCDWLGEGTPVHEHSGLCRHGAPTWDGTLDELLGWRGRRGSRPAYCGNYAPHLAHGTCPGVDDPRVGEL